MAKYNVYELLPFLWAKSEPPKSLLCHMIDVGTMAQALLRNGCMASVLKYLMKCFESTHENTMLLAVFLVSVHDIGKCHPLFQGREGHSLRETLGNKGLLDGLTYPFRHELYSEVVLQRFLRRERILGQGMKMPAAVLRIHHQGKSGKGLEPSSLIRTQWQLIQDCLLEHLREVFPADFKLLNHCNAFDGVGSVLAGLTVLSDWLASGQQPFLELPELWHSGYKALAEQAADAVLEGCALQRSFPLPGGRFFDLWKGMIDVEMRPLQRVCEENADMLGRSGLVIIEAPMGEGKTEAALYVAAQQMLNFHKEGLYIALPTAATSNQMHRRVQALLDSHGMSTVRLLHGMAWLVDEAYALGELEDRDDASRWLQPLRRAMLSPYAVGTIDQAMLSVMTVKYGILRLLGLTNKVLVLDEVHAYDAYMSQIIERLLSWCAELKVPVVLLSATLPQAKRKAFLTAYGATRASNNDAYPLITCAADGATCAIPVGQSHINRNISLEKLQLLGMWEEVAALALQRVQNGGCLCVLVNTVRDAQALYISIKALAAGDTIWLRLFHALYIADRRKHIEDECLAAFGKQSLLPEDHPDYHPRPSKAILVATQVVEQSLDLDFDAMISAIAPIDLLLQRAGRLHRHDRRIRPQAMKHPQLTVLLPEKPGEYKRTGMVYDDPLYLPRTEVWLKQHERIEIPNVMREAVEFVYDETCPQDELQRNLWLKQKYAVQLDTGLATATVLPHPDIDSFFITQNDALFFEEDGNPCDYTSARTRLGEPSTRVALLGDTLFDKVITTIRLDTYLARRVMGFSIALPAKYVCMSEAQGYEAPVEGSGVLKGVLLLKTVGNSFVFSHGGYTVFVHHDDEFGIIIERRS